MDDDALARAISASSEKVAVAFHEALVEAGVPTTPANLYALAMVTSVTITAAMTSPDEDARSIKAFGEGLKIYRKDQLAERDGATLQ
jgi:hypothetical protein